MITIENMSHAYDDPLVLEDVNVTIEDDVLLGLVGINGAGKSTFLRLLSGILIPTKGKITIDGYEPTEVAARQNIFLLPDEPYYTSHSTIDSLVKLYKTFHPGFDESICDEIVNIYGLNKKKKLKDFSKGMRRQAFIALAFGVSPKYIFLDEAFDGLDPLARKHFKDYLAKLKREKSMTVIVSSHSLLELDDFCNRFLMIDGNRMSYSNEVALGQREICKFRIVFQNEVDTSILNQIPFKVLNAKAEGHCITATFEGNEENVNYSINTLNPLVVDKLVANFEDRFISDFGHQ